MSRTTIASTATGKIESHIVNQDVTILEISHQQLNASLSLYGGQVLSWQPKGEKEVFWLSAKSQYCAGAAIRGGIPICWPWFGANVDENGVNGGNHGFARNRQWSLVSHDITDKGVELIIELTGENLHRLWPAAFKLRQTLYFGQTFSQSLAMTNLSMEEVRYSVALHSYFAVGSAEQTQVSSLNDYFFDDKITLQKQQKQQLSTGIGPIDRIYYGNATQEIIDQQQQRKIRVSSEHCQQWVLWNPGEKIAQGMDDVHLGGEQEYLCLEAAITECQSLGAGQTSTIGQTIELAQLA